MIRNEVFDPEGRCVEAEIIDLNAGTISFEVAGVVKSSRSLTNAERARYSPPEPSAEEKLQQARTVLDQIASLPAPVLTADVVDLLDDLRTVL